MTNAQVGSSRTVVPLVFRFLQPPGEENGHNRIPVHLQAAGAR